jgi:hypothetical protein
LTPEQIQAFFAWLRDLGSAGAVIFVTLAFLRYVQKRDETMEVALDKMTEAFNKLSAYLNGRDK